MPKPRTGASSLCAFWRFSLDLYARPGVAAACLRLQDEAGIDVNVLLYLLFLAHRGHRIDARALERIESVVRDWRANVVRPLRDVRRRLAAGVGAFETARTGTLLERIKALELAAEQLQQEVMERELPPQSLRCVTESPAGAARANLDTYAGILGAFPAAALDAILHGFAGLDRHPS